MTFISTQPIDDAFEGYMHICYQLNN